MLFQLHSPLNTNDLKRAFDEIRSLLSEQEVTLVSEVHVQMTVWCDGQQLQMLNEEGQHRPVFVEPYPVGNLWETSAEGKFRLVDPNPPRRTVTHFPIGRE